MFMNILRRATNNVNIESFQWFISLIKTIHLLTHGWKLNVSSKTSVKAQQYWRFTFTIKWIELLIKQLITIITQNYAIFWTYGSLPHQTSLCNVLNTRKNRKFISHAWKPNLTHLKVDPEPGRCGLPVTTYDRVFTSHGPGRVAVWQDQGGPAGGYEWCGLVWKLRWRKWWRDQCAK